jgi:hypothetical protein
VGEQVRLQKVCVDPKLRWSRVGNVWHNAGARSMIHTVAAPARAVRGLLPRRNA